MTVIETQTISFSNDMVRTSISVLPHDGYSDTRAIDITTQVFDGHDGRWLDPRTTRIFLLPADIERLGDWLRLVV
jgi:hypothetical protein